MYNEIIRKITSLTLMTIMVAGGMTFAFPGMEPAYAAGNLNVSAKAVGNFAGIQVIEIVVSDPRSSSTDETEGKPKVELNGDDVLMVQADDGSWYAYVANNQAIEEFDNGEGSILTIYRYDAILDAPLSGSDAVKTYNNTASFLKGVKAISSHPANNPALYNDENEYQGNWPFIQTYDIAENTKVTIKYGTGSTAETVSVTYDYDNTKDLSLDRDTFPYGAEIMMSLNDSLLNLSPTADDYWAFNSSHIYYFQDDDATIEANSINVFEVWKDIGFEEGPLTYDTGDDIYKIIDSKIHNTFKEDPPSDRIPEDGEPASEKLIILRQSDNDNVFVNYDTTDKSNLITNEDNKVTGQGTLTYSKTHGILLDTFDGILKFGTSVVEWLSGVALELELTDEDRNLNTRTTEDLLILAGEVPYVTIGSPIHLDSKEIIYFNATSGIPAAEDGTDSKVFTTTKQLTDVGLNVTTTWPYPTESNNEFVFSYVNFDFSAYGGTKGTFYIGSPDVPPQDNTLPTNVSFQTYLDDASNNLFFNVTIGGLNDDMTAGKVYFDVLSFGQKEDIGDDKGELNSNIERVNDAFYRFELGETDDNTAKFTGTIEYLMINQLNVFETDTYDSIETADDDIVIIINDDMDGVDAVRVSYNDVISTGDEQTRSVQQDANTHSGKIELDSTSYSAGNTIKVTLTDVDLNTNSDTKQIYQISKPENWIGNTNVWLAQLNFDDRNYEGCQTDDNPDDKHLALNSTSFSFVETTTDSGVFVGTLRLPPTYCDTDITNSTTNGVDIKFKYQDYSDASGNPNESSTDAAVQSLTGSVSLDKTVYGLPFGENKYKTHKDGTYLDATPTTITIKVNDADYNLSANGEDTLPLKKVKLIVKRGASDKTDNLLAGKTGAFVEIDPQSGIFEFDFEIEQRVHDNEPLGNSQAQQDFNKQSLADGGRIQQGDIIAVEYTDDNDASGEENTVTDSATFDLRNGVLQSDKSVYIIGTDAIITLIEPDLNLDSGTQETLSLDLIEWDSDAGTTTLDNDIFQAQPVGIRETGADTGIFQVVIEIPREIGEDKLERGEEIILEYTDNGPAGADFVGDDDEDITLKMYTSDFGASIKLDQKVYTWTDKVYITVVSPDHNFDSNSIDEIGGENKVVQINTRGDEIKDYKFVETGPDTGIFIGEVILTGFRHDADGDGTDDITAPTLSGKGPTDGFLPAKSDDGLTVSFEASDNKYTTGSALIRWNIGEIQFLDKSYPATGSGLVRVIDPDMNLNPESVDTFDINVWSDTSLGGINLNVIETNESTGIFESSLLFTVSDSTSGSRLRVAEGDTVTAKYEDNTLPAPHSTADELVLKATTIIGSIVPPLERAIAANLKPVDAFGNSLSSVDVDQQIQLTADLSNSQDKSQKFAYLLQVQDEDGVTVELSWITGDLTPGQKLSPAVSWVPTTIGTYTATVFVWESVDKPTALSPPVKVKIVVTN